MRKPAISVLIPVYNVEKYIDICLRSVVEQTFQEFEIICLNDGSTDNSAEILKRWQQQEPRLKIITQKNQGLSVARNHLLQEANGEYVAFVDADDKLDTSYLQKLYGDIISGGAEVSVCFFDHIGADGLTRTSPRLPKYYYLQPSRDPGERFRCGFYNPTAPAKLFKREFLLRNDLIFWQGRKAEDVPFTVQAYLLASQVVYVKEALYLYRQGEISSISRNLSAMTVDMLRNLWDLYFALKDKQLWSGGVAYEWIKAVVWYIARFHKLSQREQLHYMDLQQEVWQQAREETIALPGWRKYRYKLLFWLVDYFGWTSVYFWSRIFR